MARTKKTLTVLETARQRLAGLKSITPPPDFGAKLTLAGYEADINEMSARLDGYNEKLSALDQSQNGLQGAEGALREKSVRMLSAVEGLYGPDSNEYEQAGVLAVAIASARVPVSHRLRPSRLNAHRTRSLYRLVLGGL